MISLIASSYFKSPTNCELKLFRSQCGLYGVRRTCHSRSYRAMAERRGVKHIIKSGHICWLHLIAWQTINPNINQPGNPADDDDERHRVNDNESHRPRYVALYLRRAIQFAAESAQSASPVIFNWKLSWASCVTRGSLLSPPTHMLIVTVG